MTPTPSSFSEPKALAPDNSLIALSRAINQKAKAGRVDFFATQSGDQVDYAIIFQDGPKRATVRLRHRPSEADIDDIVRGLETWAGYRGDSALYSLEPPSASASEWP